MIEGLTNFCCRNKFVGSLAFVIVAGVSVLVLERTPVDVTVIQERYQERALTENTQVFVTAQGIKVFVEDYVI